MYHVGIPSSNPVLKKYEGNDIEGDISLLCYFPCDDNSVEIKPDVSNSTSSKRMKKDKPLTENNSAVQEDDNLNNTASDFLLAQALTEMENEKENIYERPKCKTYRRRESKYFFMHFCPGTITTHAESINSDLQRGQTFTTHTTLNTEQNQVAIKVSADN